MEPKSSRQTTTLTSLPPELLAHVVEYLPTASSLASLDRTSKSLHAFVEKDAWKTFARTRFPSTWPQQSPSYRDTARTLTTLSKAWDKRAFNASYTEPRDNITAFPGARKIDRWKRPRGQTIGFTPHIDVYEEIGSTWQDRKETLAFSAGAEICIRHTQRQRASHDDVKWTTYRPHSAVEGKDDVTTLHLFRHDQNGHESIISGTANGDLQLLKVPVTDTSGADVGITYFATQGLPVRSSSLLQQDDTAALLAASLGDTKIALYNIDPDQAKICPSSQSNIVPPLRADGNPASAHRAWSTTFLGPSTLAVGVGPSDEPIHIYNIDESGLQPKALRKFSLRNDFEQVVESGLSTKSVSSVYTIVPLQSGMDNLTGGNVFLSGAYDGIIRLHDLRSNRDVEQGYVDPADDSPIYSILSRGREQLVAGTNRHNLLKVFDMRLGNKAYNYLEAEKSNTSAADLGRDFNVFLRPNASTPVGSVWGGNNRSQGRNRQAESSVYSLASSSSTSPYIYAGLENAVMSLAFAEFLDPYPDPVYFRSWSKHIQNGQQNKNEKMLSGDVLSLAMYHQQENMKLLVQRSPWELWRVFKQGRRDMNAQSRLDERWQSTDEARP